MTQGAERIFVRVGKPATEATGLSNTTRFDMEQRGEFPKRVRLSGNISGYWWEDLMAWKRARQSEAA